MAFGLAAFETALLNLALDALDACERVAPSRSMLYHGDIAVQCCDGGGLLTVHWNPVTPERTNIPQGMGNPPGKRQADIHLRLYRCFPTLDENGHFPDDAGDDASEELAIDLDCLWSAVTAAICDGTLAANLTGCDALALTDASPRKPAGGCAGIELRVRAAWKPWVLDP